MVFNRYSSPFIFLDNLLLQGRFSEGVSTIYKQIDEEKLWQLYLSVPFKEKSFEDWRDELNGSQKQVVKEDNAIDFEAAKQGARNILKTFKPC